MMSIQMMNPSIFLLSLSAAVPTAVSSGFSLFVPRTELNDSPALSGRTLPPVCPRHGGRPVPMPADAPALRTSPDDMPAVPSRSDIGAAARRLAPWIRVTPLLEGDPVDLGLPERRRPLVLKLEMLQHAGSFKGRGAHNQLLGELPAAGVVAASGGNYGVAVPTPAGRA